MKGLSAIVLAAGMGTRMKSSLAKVLHPVAGRPMLLFVIDSLNELKPESVVAVIGHQADKVASILPEGIQTALQSEQLGTAHAAMTGLSKLKNFSGTVLLVSGDVPLLRAGTLKDLVARHKKAKAAISILTAVLDDPAGYGRIVRDAKGGVEKIVEQKDASESEKGILEINSGTYCFDADFLRKALKEVRTENAQKEFYLTDVVGIAKAKGLKAIAVIADDPEEVLGINSRVELSYAEQAVRYRINEKLMASGVTMIDPETTYISADAKVGRDTVIYPANHIIGGTSIGEGCTLMPGNIITDSAVKDGVTVKGYSVISQSAIESGAAVGPFAHIRPGSVIGPRAKVGNFVETKKANIGEGAKASHLSYIGDAVVGRGVNIGAGTITCNYDGYNKFQTVIEDNVFIGSDTQLVAPVKVGKGAMVAAGTTVTKDVPAGALAMSRTPQQNREGWADHRTKLKERTKAKK
jgi:bifunctional UDP-N-acetylglucosamine pyrophosphorylase / glucosamine-1-phosphate N-acetyltransferase